MPLISTRLQNCDCQAFVDSITRRINLGQVQNVVDDHDQTIGAGLDGIGIVKLLLTELSILQEGHHA